MPGKALAERTTASLSARPPYFCAGVRPWIQTCEAPASNSIPEKERVSIGEAGGGFLVFAHTGSPRGIKALTMAAAVSGRSRRLEPAPFFVTLGMGQAMLMLMASKEERLKARRAPSNRVTSSGAKSWSTKGPSPSIVLSMEKVFRLPWASPAQLIISVWVRPAPILLKKSLTDVVVMPARGASQTGFFTSTRPTRDGKDPASKEISDHSPIPLVDQPEAL